MIGSLKSLSSNRLLTKPCWNVPPEIVVQIWDTFDDNKVIKNYFTKYLKESCW